MCKSGRHFLLSSFQFSLEITTRRPRLQNQGLQGDHAGVEILDER